MRNLITIAFFSGKSRKPWASIKITKIELAFLKNICRREHISMVTMWERMIRRHCRKVIKERAQAR